MFKATEEGPVTITRRDGEALVLAKASDVARQRAGLELAAQLVAASLAPADVPFVVRLRAPFPWLEFLRPTDRDAFAQEVVDVARACAAVSQFDRLLITVRRWQATAEAIAVGYTADADLDWFEDPSPVIDPRTA